MEETAGGRRNQEREARARPADEGGHERKSIGHRENDDESPTPAIARVIREESRNGKHEDQQSAEQSAEKRQSRIQSGRHWVSRCQAAGAADGRRARAAPA